MKMKDYYHASEVTSRRIKAYKEGYNKALEDVKKELNMGIDVLNNVTTISGRKPKCCQAQMMLIKKKVKELKKECEGGK